MADEALSLAARLKQRRAELGLSQAEAARELDVARTAYRLWEMEAAKPSPDRWRLIARWLGVSVSTMLVAEELITNEEAGSAPTALVDLDREEVRRAGPDARDFYRRADRALVEGVEHGDVSRSDAEALGVLLRTIEHDAPGTTTDAWERADFRKALALDADAPSLARDAMRVTASGIPAAPLADATILVSELVSCAVGSDAVGDTMVLVIAVPRDRVSVNVSVRLGDATAGFPVSEMVVRFLTAMATRWGSGKLRDGTVHAWFDVDVALPGA